MLVKGEVGTSLNIHHNFRSFFVDRLNCGGGIEAIAASISADLVLRLPRQNKKQRDAERLDMRYQYISRLLGNEHFDVDWVMAPFAREVLTNAAKGRRKLPLFVDQSKCNDTQHAVVSTALSAYPIVFG